MGLVNQSLRLTLPEGLNLEVNSRQTMEVISSTPKDDAEERSMEAWGCTRQLSHFQVNLGNQAAKHMTA